MLLPFTVHRRLTSPIIRSTGARAGGDSASMVAVKDRD
jgi:hypothetical protein